MAVNRELERAILNDLIERLESGNDPHITNREYIKGVAERGLRDELVLIRGAAQHNAEGDLCDDCLIAVLHEVIDEFIQKEPMRDPAPAVVVN